MVWTQYQYSVTVAVCYGVEDVSRVGSALNGT
jgi:hypothetical protein